MTRCSDCSARPLETPSRPPPRYIGPVKFPVKSHTNSQSNPQSNHQSNSTLIPSQIHTYAHTNHHRPRPSYPLCTLMPTLHSYIPPLTTWPWSACFHHDTGDRTTAQTTRRSCTDHGHEQPIRVARQGIGGGIVVG